MSINTSSCSISASQQLFETGLENQQQRIDEQQQNIQKQLSEVARTDPESTKLNLAESMKGIHLDLFA